MIDGGMMTGMDLEKFLIFFPHSEMQRSGREWENLCAGKFYRTEILGKNS